MKTKMMLLAMGCVQAAAWSVCGVARAGTTYTAILLDSGTFGDTQARGVSGGQVVGTGGGKALLWNSATSAAINLTPSGYTSATAFATSGDEQVGAGGNAVTSSHALLWTGSAASAVDLNPSGYALSTASAVFGGQQGGSGQVDPNGPSAALLWNGSPTSYVNLNPAGFYSSVVYGMSNGQQVGEGQTSQFASASALLWTGSAGSAVDLTPTGYYQAEALGAGDGAQVGFAQATATSPTHAALWVGSAGTFIDLDPDAGFTDSRATGIANGYQVGAESSGGAGDASYHALVWHGSADSVIDLEQFLPIEYPFSSAAGIDEQGDIVGIAETADRMHVAAVEWIPTTSAVPLPSAAWTGIIAMAGLIGCHRLRRNRRIVL